MQPAGAVLSGRGVELALGGPGWCAGAVQEWQFAGAVGGRAPSVWLWGPPGAVQCGTGRGSGRLGSVAGQRQMWQASASGGSRRLRMGECVMPGSRCGNTGSVENLANLGKDQDWGRTGKGPGVWGKSREWALRTVCSGRSRGRRHREGGGGSLPLALAPPSLPPSRSPRPTAVCHRCTPLPPLQRACGGGGGAQTPVPAQYPRAHEALQPV